MDRTGTRVAVFDLDGTLSRRDLYLAFLLDALRRRGPARPVRAAALPWITGRHLLRITSNDQLKAAYLDAVLGGRPRQVVEDLAEAFAERAVAREMKPRGIEQISRHRRAGDTLVLASASLDVYVEPIARRLGFDAAVATRVAWTPEGRVAGTLAGPNLRGPAKLDAVRAALPALPRLVAYSDHQSDEVLLAAAEEAVAVDPTPALRRIAALRGWKIADWKAGPSTRDPLLDQETRLTT